MARKKKEKEETPKPIKREVYVPDKSPANPVPPEKRPW